MTVMRSLALRMTIALVLGVTAWSASAQTQQPGAASLGVQLKNASPVQKTGCPAKDVHCPAGAKWTCGPYGQRCWCTLC
jgi:hypothetical protein